MDLKFLRLISIGLKIIELVLALICIGVVASKNYHEKQFDVTVVYNFVRVSAFILITSAFVIPTFLLLVVHIHKRSYDNQRKSLFELLYNVSAVIFLVSVSAALLSFSGKFIPEVRNYYRAGGILGLANTAFYGASTAVSFLVYQMD